MKILVIFTGGTIESSTKSDGWVAPNPTVRNRLLSNCKDRFKNDIEFETESPYTLLSENLTSNELTTLCGYICDSAKKDFDGIIVTHGTDSLQYSAAAAAFCLGPDSIPVVFVSSNYPLENNLANGEINFEAAVKFIKSKYGKGVYICYANGALNKANIHSAARVLRHAEMSDKIYSLGDRPYARYLNGNIELCKEYVISTKGTGCGKVVFAEDSGVLTVSVSPYEQYAYNLDGIKSIIAIPYHSGTLNTSSNKFTEFCLNAKQKNIPIFLSNIPSSSSYESMLMFENLGITPLPPCSSIAISVKAWIAVSLDLPIKAFVEKPIAEEFLNK